MKFETNKGRRRCYEPEWWKAHRQEDICCCGHAQKEDGKWWCTLGGGTGKLEGYSGSCGNIYPWKNWELTDEDYQLTFEDLKGVKQ